MVKSDDYIDQTLFFEKFKILSCLKKDSFSSVYLADHIYLNKKIILKVLHTANLSDPSVLERFKREAKIMARLDHPNIIRVLDFGQSGSDFYLSFEFFDSRNLREVLKNRDLDLDQKKNIFIQLVQGLSTAHQAGIIHRDIKPENLLINDQQQSKIADFGLALAVDEIALTKKSSIVGTPAYMSPEQIRGETLTPQSDLFSLGIVAYEVFYGNNPFTGHDINSTINAILTSDLRQIISQQGSIDEKVQQVISGCLQRDKHKRIKSAAEILEILEVEKTDRPSRFKSGKRKRIMAALTVIISSVVIILFLVKVSDQEKGDSGSQVLINQPADTINGNISEDKNSLKGKVSSGPMLSTKHAGEYQHDSAGGQSNFILIGTPFTMVFIDSQEIGQIPLKSAVSLPAGMHDLTLIHNDFPYYSQKLEIQAGKNHIMQLAMDTLFGYLNCQIYPWGELYMDGTAKGQSPFLRPLILSPGKHSLTISNPAWPEFRDTIIISRKETTDYRINFEQINRWVKTDTTEIP